MLRRGYRPFATGLLCFAIISIFFNPFRFVLPLLPLLILILVGARQAKKVSSDGTVYDQMYIADDISEIVDEEVNTYKDLHFVVEWR